MSTLIRIGMLSQIEKRRSVLMATSSQDKRNLWWKAFRKTVLEPHAIAILDNPMTDKVPHELLALVEIKCQTLERYETQASVYLDATSQYQGFDSALRLSSNFLPPIPLSYVSRCVDAILDEETLPSQEDSLRQPLFDMPAPNPGLVSGFASNAFTEAELKEMPTSLTVNGLSDNADASISSCASTNCAFLLFERAYGSSKYEVESAMNYCAMNGAAALNAIATLYDLAWPEQLSKPVRNQVVFSCIIENNLGIINHHWRTDGGFFAAPLCKFDLRDLEHFMHFLAWVEAIEEWAATYLLPDIRKALTMIVDRKEAGLGLKALPSPFTDMEKQEKLSQAMRLAFENIPWKGERSRKTPLGVTGAMRLRSPKVEVEPETIITPMNLSHPQEAALLEPGEIRDVDRSCVTEQVQLLVSTEAQIKATEATHTGATKDTVLPALPLHAATVIPVDKAKQIQNSDTQPKRKDSRIGLFLIKSAGLPKISDPSIDPRPATSAGLTTGKSLASSVRTVPDLHHTTGKSPGIVSSTVELKSPSDSMVSIQSKRSFTSLRRGRKIKSPNTPDFAGSPRENTNGLKFRIANSLDMIKEHAMPKRNRGDNSAPTSARELGALPTPAYDKKRFDIKTPRPALPPTPATTEGKFVSAVAIQPMPKHVPTIKNSDQDIYDSKHDLPLRQWATSPRSAITNTTTLTAVA